MFGAFLEVAKMLNERFGVEPALFGSLGLGRAVDYDFSPDDIDLLVDREFLETRWGDIQKEMGELGFEMIDEREHEFDRNAVKVAFGKDDLKNLVGFSVVDGARKEEASARFVEFTPEQYLVVYEKFLTQEHRKSKRDKDLFKIAKIKDFLK